MSELGRLKALIKPYMIFKPPMWPFSVIRNLLVGGVF